MAIEAQCPHCRKPYKFKDEMKGKRVKCAAAGCRQVFEVRVMTREEIEAVALAAIGDNPAAAVAPEEDTRTIRVTCTACDHVWEEPWAKQGKNTLCPECRHRQKVPEQKAVGTKADWRDPKSGRPSLAKQEEVPDDVWGSSKSNVSVKALKDAGAIPEVEYEPRPVKFWVTIAAVVVAVLGAAGYGGYRLFFSSGTEKRDKLMREAVAALPGIKDAGLNPPTAAAAEGLLRIYDGEYQARSNTPERFKAAQDQFAGSRALLDAGPKGIERDSALAEWLTAVVALGGDEDQAKGGTRITWEPQTSTARARVNVKLTSVVEELQTGMASLQKATDLETRITTLRRLTGVLADHKQTKLVPALLGQGFTAAEIVEAQGFLGLDLLKLGDQPAARAVAGELDGAIAEKEKENAPGSVRALWHVTQVKPLATIPPGTVGVETRLALTLAKAAEKDGAGAAAEAVRPGSTNAQFRALGLAGESLDDPAVLVAKALEHYNVVRNNREVQAGVSVTTWARLARAAGRAGNDEAAKAFVEAPTSEEGRAHAQAEWVRGKLTAGGTQKADPGWADLPPETKRIRTGHLIARYLIARHNGRLSGDAGQAKEFESWPKEMVRPFGLAGLALGLRDKSQQ